MAASPSPSSATFPVDQAPTLSLAGETSPDESDTDPGDPPDEPDEFVGGYLSSVCQRPIKGRNRVWAARWWDLPLVSGPTVVRLQVLWRSWERLRQDATTGMSCGGVTTPTTTWRYSWIPTDFRLRQVRC